MKKKKSKSLMKLLSWILLSLIIVTQFPSVKILGADNVTFPFFTNITLFDEHGNDLSDEEDVSKNSKVTLKYDFNIPNTEENLEGKIYTFTIPDQIKIQSQIVQPLEFGDDIIANVTVDTSGQGTVTFTEYADVHADISGYFEINTEFDEDKIGNEDPTLITFVLTGVGDINISIDFDQPEPSPPTIVKTGEYNSESNKIAWKIKITPNVANSLESGSIFTDAIPNGQAYIENSAKIYKDGDEANASTDGFNFVDSTLRYVFQEDVNDIYWIEFEISVDDPNLFILGTNAQNKTLSNTAKIQYLPDSSKVVEDTGNVTIPLKLISKQGEYDKATETLSWSIIVNENNFSIDNAIVEDTVDSRLSLENITIQRRTSESPDTWVNATTSSTTVDGNKYTFNLGNIDSAYRITYEASLPDDFYLTYNSNQTFTNNAVLNGTIGGLDVSAPARKGVRVDSNLIHKSQTGNTEYDASTQEVSWTIKVNKNKESLTNAVVLDTIPSNQKLIESSFLYDNSQVTNIDISHVDGNTLVNFTFISPLEDEAEITFKTQVTDPNLTSVNKSNGSIRNNVTLYANELNIDGIKTSATQGVNSLVLSKSGTGYNYDTRTLSWKIEVNQNKMELPGVFVRDIIPIDEQTLLKSSISIKDISNNNVGSYDYDDETGELVFDLGDIPQNNSYTITFDTQIKEESVLNVLEENGNIPINNTAILTHGLDNDIQVQSTGTNYIKNTVIGKSGVLGQDPEDEGGNKYIDWKVLINSNDLPINDFIEITDVLQEGLLLDTDTVKLYHEQLNTNGDMTEVTDNPVESQKYIVSYNGMSRELKIKINDVDGPYMLTFRTYATKSGNYSNTISFLGSTVTEDSDSSQYNIVYQTSGGGAVGTLGSVTIEKTDADDKELLLDGAKFLLLDKNNVPVQEKETINGLLTFDDLLYNRTYYIKETKAPDNYILNPDYGENENSYYASFLIKKTGEILLTPYKGEQESINGNILVSNIIIKGNVQIKKLGETHNPLPGAVFVLKQGDEIKYTSQPTDDAGTVLMENIPYGSYTLEESTAPEGYKLSSDSQDVEITQNGVTLNFNFENEKIRGNINILKTDTSDNPLPGAIFSLFQGDEVKYSSLPTGDDGKASINNVEYGTYILKETKAPKGYSLSENEQTVVIDKDGITADYTFENLVRVGELITTKEVDKDYAQINDTFGYIITVKLKEDNSQLNDVIITDNIPEGLIVVPGSITLDGEPLSDDVLNNGTIEVSLGDLIDTTIHSLYFKVEVIDENLIGKKVKNVAIVGGSDPNDPEKPIIVEEPVVDIPVTDEPLGPGDFNNDNNGNDNSPDTGDNMNLYGYLAVMILSGIGIFLIMRGKSLYRH